MLSFSQSVSTRLLSSLQCYKSTQRQVSVSSIVRDSTGPECRYRSTPTSNRAYPRPVVCHVPRCLNTNSDPLLHTSYCEYRPNHTFKPCSNARHLPQRYRPKRRQPTLSTHSTTGFTMPFVVQSTVEAKTDSFLYWVRLNELPRNLVLHQQKV